MPQPCPWAIGWRAGARSSHFRSTGPCRTDLLPHIEGALRFHRNFFAAPEGRSPLALALNHNFGAYLPCDLLVKMDRTSMAHALEARSPFLDTALVEYVSGLPDDYKLRGRTTKYILRKAFADLMPPEIRSRGKMGFGIPLGTWFREPPAHLPDRPPRLANRPYRRLCAPRRGRPHAIGPHGTHRQTMSTSSGRC